ncbi:MAG: protein-disulfide reductase DsbD domain-containing protein [Phycisphaerales bacterium JB059]
MAPLLSLIASATPALAQPDPWDTLEQDRPHATVRLLAPHSAIAPGSEFLLALTFDIEEGWHIYWDGKNDSGFPIGVDLRLPEGFTARPLLWPGPTRKIMPGDILDHVYKREATLLIPVQAPTDLGGVESVEFSASVEWLVCETYCIPEADEVALTLPVVANPEAMTPSRDANFIKRALVHIPTELTAKTRGVAIVWEGDRLVIRADNATEILFYPKSDCPDLIDPIAGALVEGDELTLEFDPEGEETQVRGVIEVRRANQRRPALYEMSTPRP